MKKTFGLFLIAILSITLLSCGSQGKKAANEYLNCVEQAIDNSSTMEDASSKAMKCAEDLKSKYQSKIASDPDFAKDFMEESAKVQKEITEKMTKKFNKK